MRYLFLFLTSFCLTACSGLQALNNFNPKDGESRLLAKDITYSAAHDLDLDIYAPKSATKNATEKLPVILFVYGGSWRDGDKDLYRFAGRALAAKGYVTVAIDYRKLPNKFPDFLYDTAQAVAWIEDNIENYNGDPSRIYLTGHSAGGYNVSMVAIDPQYLTAAGTTNKNIKAVAPIAGPADFYPFEWDSVRAVFGEAENPATATQPVKLISDGYMPVFKMFHGADDTTVYPVQSENLAKALKDKGHQADVKIYPDTDHALIIMAFGKIHRGKVSILDDVTAFFDAH